MRRASWSALGIVALFASSAFAEASVDEATKSAARALAEHALDQMDAHKFDAALQSLQKALALVQMPTLGVRAARCLERLGRLVEASEMYRRVDGMLVDTSAPEAFRRAQERAKAEAVAERDVLARRIPSLQITLRNAANNEVELRIDGALVTSAIIGVGRPMDPGAHHLEVKRGSDVVTRDVALVESQPNFVDVVLPERTDGLLPEMAARGAAGPVIFSDGLRQAAASSPARNRTWRTVGWVGLGAGGVGLAVGGVMYGLALAKYQSIKQICAGSGGAEGALSCPADRFDEAQRDGRAYDSLSGISSASFIAGGALAGLGVAALGFDALYVTPSVSNSATRVRPWVGLSGAGLSGVF